MHNGTTHFGNKQCRSAKTTLRAVWYVTWVSKLQSNRTFGRADKFGQRRTRLLDPCYRWYRFTFDGPEMLTETTSLDIVVTGCLAGRPPCLISHVHNRIGIITCNSQEYLKLGNIRTLC